MIDALRHVLTLKIPTKTPDGGGGFDTTWTEPENPIVRADIRTSANGVFLRTRWRSDITVDCRLQGEDRIYRIISVADARGTREWLDIMVREIF